MLVVLFNSRKVNFIPFCFQSRLCHYRIPIQQFAVFARRDLNRFSIHYLFVFYHIVESNCQLTCCIETNISHFAIDHASHVVHNLFHYSSISFYSKFFVDCALHRVSKRDLFRESHICAIVVSYNKFSTHTARSSKSRHWHFEHIFASESIFFTFCQYVIHSPSHNRHNRHHLFFHAQHEFLISSQFEVDIVLFEFVDEDTTKFLSHFATSSDSPVIREHHTSRAVEAKVEFHSSIFATFVFHYEVELFVFSFNFRQIKAIPSFASHHLFTSPVEVFCFIAGQVHDVACFILLSRKFDVLSRTKIQV